ncbi:hypothetical protein PG999_010914 [Apiospora kogelbergensis]|uniref:Uncharacterized protein n=1 Tax=Apiospora kogelbergensis TaxID=1337665 RepID=A0AAW0QBI4_9PEZI
MMDESARLTITNALEAFRETQLTTTQLAKVTQRICSGWTLWWAYWRGGGSLRTGEHALVNGKHWQRVMKGAGFAAVEWSDGESPELKTVRLIGAFPTANEASSDPNGGVMVMI